jgi:RNA polymerase sigma-70 factor (ECF subfamily)
MTRIEFNKKFLDVNNSLEMFAFSLTADKRYAKDLMQDSFKAALKNRHSFIIGNNFKCWTFTIMKNLFLQKYKMMNTSPQVQYKHSFFPNETYLSAFDLGWTYSANALVQHLEQLNDECRIIFKMHLEGYKYKEIADKLNIKKESVKSSVFFTRKALMDQLSD